MLDEASPTHRAGRPLFDCKAEGFQASPTSAFDPLQTSGSALVLNDRVSSAEKADIRRSIADANNSTRLRVGCSPEADNDGASTEGKIGSRKGPWQTV